MARGCYNQSSCYNPRGGCNNPQHPLFSCVLGLQPYNPPPKALLRPPDPIQMPTPHRPLPRPLRFLRCACPCPGTLPAFASPPAACDAIAPPAPLPQTHATADATAHRHGAIDFLFKLSARQSSQLHAQPRCPSRPSGGSLRVNSRPRPLACAMSAA